MRHTEIDLSDSFLREHGGKFVVRHGRRLRGEPSPARARAQHLWARKRLAEQDIDVSEYAAYHVVPAASTTTVYFGR